MARSVGGSGCRIIVIKGYHNFFNFKAKNHTAGERILPLGGEIYLIRSFSGSLFGGIVNSRNAEIRER